MRSPHCIRDDKRIVSLRACAAVSNVSEIASLAMTETESEGGFRQRWVWVNEIQQTRPYESDDGFRHWLV